MPKSYVTPKLKIIASDIDEHALEAARTGRYPATIAKDVQERLLEKYFAREDGTYRVVSELRELCLFSPHNVLQDPPFSKLDLISCRNFLIYLSSEMQARLLPIFHYALLESGYLLLGPSENVTRHANLFSVINKGCRIFKRQSQARRRLPEFPLTAGVPKERRVPSAHLTPQAGGPRDLAEQLLLEQYSPAYVVINADGDVLYASARTGKYLELPAGPPIANVYSMARSDLRLELRAVVHKASHTGRPAVQTNITIGTNGGQQTLNLIVQPIRNDGMETTLSMVVFQEIGGILPVPDLDHAETVEDTEGTTLRQLEADLRATRERLQSTIEELETSNEELKSGNEELSSVNEELQSANEELETSKEELQSINEELQTVNAELKTRVDELSRANSDMANLLESTQIAMVFLDTDFAVKSFTPAAKDLFHFVESDVGRPILHIRSRLRLDKIEEDAERVLRTLLPVEEKVEREDIAKRYIMRILPYRRAENVIAGVVVNFIDITRITAAETEIATLTHELRNRVESLERILDLVPVGIFIGWGDTLQHVQVNRYAARLLGNEDGQKGPRDLSVPYRLFDHDRELPFWEQPLQRAAFTGQAVSAVEGRFVRSDSTSLNVLVSAEPLFDEQAKPRGAVAAIVDISDRKELEKHQSRLLHELQHRVKNILANVTSLASRMLTTSTSLEEFGTGFQGRLMVMGRVHELLSRGVWQGVGLNELVLAVLEPYLNSHNDNVLIGGPNVVLPANVATTLGMALHELATNAIKYGALSVPAGRVDISWQTGGKAGTKRLEIAWIERNGLRIEAFPQMGFGMRLVIEMIDYELTGVAKVNFRPEGLQCRITIPLPAA